MTDVTEKASGLTEHPAKFSAAVMTQAEAFIRRYVLHRPLYITDPFAGVG